MIIVDPVPGLDCVAQFASPARHQLIHLSLVRILVARLNRVAANAKLITLIACPDDGL